MTVYTIGHSTRSWDDFLGLLRENSIARLIDVRRYPGSRKYPQFGRDALPAALEAARIKYIHEPGLGGRRAARGDSPNVYWKSASFRAYADYMATKSFEEALGRVLEAASSDRCVLLCAEAVPWRCHRSLIADALTAHGREVVHILGPGKTMLHSLNEHAQKQLDGRLVYR
jgi:uncharacterized protein (DUF488 family)